MSKKNKLLGERTVYDILDSNEADVLVVRGKDCETLHMNTSARNRLADTELSHFNCRRGYSKLFPELCVYCPNYDEEDYKKEGPGTIRHKDGSSWLANGKKVYWLDEKSATILYVNNITSQTEEQEKLYSLAYLDQLTSVPNRAKFKKDFEAVAADIAANRLEGAVALFDLDNFKAINDTYGHNTGDLMLRRLTEHILGEAAFSGHLYRLGGDEFVLFFTQPAGKYMGDDALKAYYNAILQPAFMAYTMPNIELSCTLSMGVALIPKHGENVSELLRKADIALYKAKTNGRNQLIFFEDQYDAAKKFKDLYINVQPILTQHGRTYGYELVDRGNEEATAGDVNLTEYDRTLDALNLGDMDNDSRYFIAYSNQLTNKAVLNNLPKDKFIIQIKLEDEMPKVQLEKYRRLRAAGYTLAADGLVPEKADAMLMQIADYFKFAPHVNDYKKKKFIAENRGKRFIATSVDTAEAFEKAKQEGYLLFQGYFFQEPTVLKKTKDIDPMRVNYMRLLKLTSTDDYVDFREISGIIASDVALSYKLMRLLNSAAVGLRNRISSIDMGVAYLGEEHLKKWVALLALRGVASDTVLELVRLSLIRARFGELLAPHYNPRRNTQHVFLTGMFSLLHIALEKPQEELFDEIPVADDIRLSLLTRTGLYSDMIAFFTQYEYGNWEEVSNYGAKHRLNDNLINDSYLASVKWYNDLSNEGENS